MDSRCRSLTVYDELMVHYEHRPSRTLGHLAKRADSEAELMNLCLSESTNRHLDHIERPSYVNSSLLLKMANSANVLKKRATITFTLLITRNLTIAPTILTRQFLRIKKADRASVAIGYL